MDKKERTKHWENIFKEKNENEVSWYQEKPTESIELIENLHLNKKANIIDAGAGSSYLPDSLLKLGYENIYALDISSSALAKSKKRLRNDADKIHWIVEDITTFNPPTLFDCWHDRAVFHFLTDDNDILKYVTLTHQSITKNGYLIIGTFSDKGPTKCSGIPIKQYTETDLEKLFSPYFDVILSKRIDHQTPFNTIQNFVFVVFKKR
jgi:SAM-dependent methyltransferase